MSNIQFYHFVDFDKFVLISDQGRLVLLTIELGSPLINRFLNFNLFSCYT